LPDVAHANKISLEAGQFENECQKETIIELEKLIKKCLRHNKRLNITELKLLVGPLFLLTLFNDQDEKRALVLIKNQTKSEDGLNIDY
jgi:hypothetical protein